MNKGSRVQGLHRVPGGTPAMKARSRKLSLHLEDMRTLDKTMVAAFLVIACISLKIYAVTPKRPAPQIWTPGCVASVPKAWGIYRGGSAQSGPAFEDSGGTPRFLTNIPCDGTPAVALEIRRAGGNPPSAGSL